MDTKQKGFKTTQFSCIKISIRISYIFQLILMKIDFMILSCDFKWLSLKVVIGTSFEEAASLQEFYLYGFKIEFNAQVTLFLFSLGPLHAKLISHCKTCSRKKKFEKEKYVGKLRTGRANDTICKWKEVGPIQLVQMNISWSNTHKNTLTDRISTLSNGFEKNRCCRTSIPTYSFL